MTLAPDLAYITSRINSHSGGKRAKLLSADNSPRSLKTKRVTNTMTNISLEQSQKIAVAAAAKGAELGLKPLCITVLDSRASLRLCINQDGTSIDRHRIAHGKANAALSLGMGSRALGDRAEVQAYFVDAVGRMVNGDFIPVPGGVLIKDASRAIIGAVGISGDASDNDEIAAVAGIESVGLIPDTGA